MKCPHCSIELKISERKNIEIDYCPECRGVWLDRGELDKLIDSSGEEYRPERRSKHDDDDDYEHGSYKQHRYKRKSLLSELFDF